MFEWYRVRSLCCHHFVRFFVNVRHAPIFILLFLFELSIHASSQQYERNTFRLGLEGGVNLPGDEFTRKQTGYTLSPSTQMTFEYFPLPSLGVHALGYGGKFYNEANDLRITKYGKLGVNSVDYKTTYFGGAIGATYAFPDLFHFSPILFARAGLMFHSTTYNLDDIPGSINNRQIFSYGAGVSVEYPFSPAFSGRVSFSAFLTNTDELDGFALGGKNDGFSMFTVGFFWRMNPAPDMKRDGSNIPISAKDVNAPKESNNPIESSLQERSVESETPTSSETNNSAPYTSVDPTLREHINVHELPSQQTPTLPPPAAKSNLLDARLQTVSFTSLQDLQANPQNLLLSYERDGSGPLSTKVHFELVRDRKTVMSGTHQTSLYAQSGWMNAQQLINREALKVARGYEGPLPSGEYTVYLSLKPDAADKPLILSERLTHIDFESIFGEDAEKVLALVRSGKASVELKPGNEILFNVFGDNPSRTPSPTPRRSGSGGIKEPPEETDREAATVIPENIPIHQQASFITDAIRDAMDKAQLIDNAIKRPRKTAERISIIVTELYFPFDVANLTDEGRMILDQMSQALIQHPELGAEIRAFSDEIGDASYNNHLSQRRADRVFEYLSRKQVPESRLRARGLGQASTESDGEMLKKNRRAQIVVGSRK